MKIRYNRNLILLLISQAINVIGDNFFNIAIMWVVYEKSHSTLASALIGVLWHVTDMIIAPVAGVLADTKNKKHILITTNGLSSLFCFLIAMYFIMFNEFSLWVSMGAIVLLNILTAFTTPTRSALLPQLVNSEDIGKVNGQFSSIVQVASMIGSSLGGIILSILGIGVSILLNSISFAIVTSCFVFFNWDNVKVRNKISNNKIKYQFYNDFIEGIKYLQSERHLIKITVFLVLLNTISFLGPLYPALIFERLGDNSTAYGIIQTLAVIGGLCGALIISKKQEIIKNERISSSICLIIVSISLFGLTFSENLLISAILTFVQYIANAINSIIITTLIMKNTDNEYMGRILGLTKSIAVLLIPVTTLLAGYIGTKIDIEYIFILAAILVGVISIIGYFLLKPSQEKTDREKNDYELNVM